jgi:hypothetical protein
MTGYHVTKRANRLAIRRWGLIPRNTAQHPRANFHGYGWANADVDAVFANEAVYEALAWRSHQSHRYGPDADIWKIDLTGLATEVDPYRRYHDRGSGLATSLRVMERVTPDRLTLLRLAT